MRILQHPRTCVLSYYSLLLNFLTCEQKEVHNGTTSFITVIVKFGLKFYVLFLKRIS